MQGTIRDNILYGTDDILPDDELFCILNSLGLIKEDCGEHFLAFLDRDINPLGSGLSGGEIQRLCIARALARKKKIIVLDEPTASIGEELAIKIITYIRQHCPTVIITTHNPRILELADHFLMVCQSLASLLEKAETNKPHTLIHLYLIPRFASRGKFVCVLRVTTLNVKTVAASLRRQGMRAKASGSWGFAPISSKSLTLLR